MSSKKFYNFLYKDLANFCSFLYIPYFLSFFDSNYVWDTLIPHYFFPTGDCWYLGKPFLLWMILYLAKLNSHYSNNFLEDYFSFARKIIVIFRKRILFLPLLVFRYHLYVLPCGDDQHLQNKVENCTDICILALILTSVEITFMFYN